MKIYLFNSDFSLNCQIGTPDLHQYEDNATLVFCHIDGIDEANYTDYVATFAATLPGATAPTADIVTEFGELEVSGISYKGFKYFVSRKFTQIAGSLNANFVLAKDGVTKVSQSVYLNVMASSGGAVWNESITQAQWYQLLAYSVGLRNPNLGVIDLSAANILDDYNTDDQLGAYMFSDELGNQCLLFVSKDDGGDYVQNVLCMDGGSFYTQGRTYFSDAEEWGEWQQEDNSSAISYSPENGGKLKQLSNYYTVQEAITALDKLMGNPVVFSADCRHNLEGISIDAYFKFSETAGGYTITNLDDSNLSDDDYALFVSKYAKIGKVIPSANLIGNQITMVCADGSVYSLMKEGGTTARLMLVGRYATKGELDALHNSFETKSLLVKDGSITILRAQNNNIVINGGGNYIGINPSLIEFHDKGNTYSFPYPSGTTQTADESKLATVGMVNDLLDLSDNRYGADFDMSLDSSYVLTIALKDYDGNTLRTRTVDFPAEMAFVNASYDNDTKDLTFALQNGNTVVVPLDDIISGLATETYVDTAISTATSDMATKTWTNTQLGYYYTKNQTNANFAPLKGDAPYLTVGAANNFTPYGPETTSNQTAPFIIEGTATNNNTGKVDTGTLAYIKAKLGNSVVVNQKVESVSNTDGTINAGEYKELAQAIVGGYHKLLIIGMVTSSNLTDLKWRIVGKDASDNFKQVEQAVTSSLMFFTAELKNYDNTGVFVRLVNTSESAVSYTDASCGVVDLTQWFGSNDLIPSDLLTHPEHFARYYNGSLEYNEGEIVSAQGAALISRGRNAWDEKTELGYIDNETGAYIDPVGAYANTLRSKNFCQCLPSTSYYGLQPSDKGSQRIFWYDADKNYIGSDYIKNTTAMSPANAYYFKWALYNYGTTYNNDITISIYYPNEGGYDQYYAYVGNVGAVVTGSEILRSCGSVYDEKKPNGKITRVLGEVDLSDLTWSYNSSGNGYWTAEYTDGYAYGGAETPIALSEKYVPGNYNDNILGGTAGYVFYNDEKIYVNNGSSSIEPSGKLIFKLAAPEEENGTSFPANLPIEDFGYLEWAYPSSAKKIPQGIEIDYPADYRGFVDSLLREVGGDTTKIVNAAMSQSDFDDVMEGYGYYKESDITSDIETTANLYVTNKKAYKTGRVVTISISAANMSGSDIAANATLFTLPNYLYSASYDMRFPSEAGTIVISTDGKLSLTSSIANNGRVDIYISYAI